MQSFRSATKATGIRTKSVICALYQEMNQLPIIVLAAFFCRVSLVHGFDLGRGTETSHLTAKAWDMEQPGAKWPELEIPEIANRPSTAICFSGGGSRAFLSAIGLIAGLKELDLMDQVQYITGVSGGFWAASVYVYSQLDISDDELLGKILPPEDLTLEALSDMNPRCTRSLVNNSLVKECLKNLFEEQAKNLDKIWIDSVSKIFLEPMGIEKGTFFSLNQATVDDIKKRNPQLESEKFLIPRFESRPFLIGASSLMGPVELAPLYFEKTEFTILEYTPLYIGESHIKNMTYYSISVDEHGRKHEQLSVGGYVESFAFGLGAPSKGTCETAEDSIKVPYSKETEPFSLANAVGTSSNAVEGFFTVLPLPEFVQVFGSRVNYWSPVLETPSNKNFFVGDGGSLENVQLIGMLKRRVKNIVLVISSEYPLRSQKQWNPFSRKPNFDDIDFTIPGFFGIDTKSPFQIGYDSGKNQVFNKADFPRVVVQMQEALDLGNGIVVTTELVTVANDYWGIPAGIKSNITWVMLSRAFNWENKLPKEVRNLVIPKYYPDDPSITPSHGEFANFPHFSTLTQVQLGSRQSNLLSNLVGWVIKENSGIFRDIFNAPRKRIK